MTDEQRAIVLTTRARLLAGDFRRRVARREVRDFYCDLATLECGHETSLMAIRALATDDNTRDCVDCALAWMRSQGVPL